jgi:phosphatidylglycerol:prolipoprotein diacylglycerol transferase
LHSVLFKIGPVAIRTYGFLLALAFILGIWFSAKRAKKQGMDINWLPDLSLIILITALLGSRFFYVIRHLGEFEGHPWDMINPIQSSGEIGIGGLSMFGGLVLAIIFSLIYLRLKKLNVQKIADIVAPSIMLGLGVARIGCFLNGCCFGKPTGSFLGVIFPPDSPAGYFFPDTRIFPIQLVSSLMGFSICAVLLMLERFKKFDGFTFWLMLALYAMGRFTIDFFRYYEESMVFAKIGGISFSMNQALTVLIFFISIFMWNHLRLKAKRSKIFT